MRIFRRVSRSLKSVVRSPVLKTVAGGVAISFPVVGVPAVAGVALANRALAVADQSPAKAKALKRTIARTQVLARAGDEPARRALSALSLAAAARQREPAAMAKVRRIGLRATIGSAIGGRYLVTANGRLRRRR
jgi:hypothetical protein